MNQQQINQTTALEWTAILNLHDPDASHQVSVQFN